MFTASEFLEIQYSVEEALQYMLTPISIIRKRREGSDIDSLYKESKFTNVDIIPFIGAVNVSPDEKILSMYGLEEKETIQVEIPKIYLDRENKSVNSTDLIEYHGTRYVIRKVFRNGEFPVDNSENNAPNYIDYLTLVILAVSERESLELV